LKSHVVEVLIAHLFVVFGVLMFRVDGIWRELWTISIDTS
jgi:hypothetical protein